MGGVASMTVVHSGRSAGAMRGIGCGARHIRITGAKVVRLTKEGYEPAEDHRLVISLGQRSLPSDAQLNVRRAS
jgi:hypothetical protein